jgi:lysozyme family protein
MDQQGWDRIYDDLDRDLDGAATRGGNGPDLDLYLDIDRARFAMDKGEYARAIELLESVRKRLDVIGTTRGGSLPSAAALEDLEDQALQELRLGSAKLEVVGEAELPDEQVTRSGAGATKVNRSTKFDDIKDEYVEMFENAKITPAKADQVRWYSNKVVAGRATYEEISRATDVPWYMIGLIHGMECGYSMQKHLHNGDSLKARTWQVPKGHPKDGDPPFTFVASAIDALGVDKLTGLTDWDLPHILYRLELYNGWGYRKSRGMATPYLWSFSNHHQRGKYVQDGVFDPNAPSSQCGAAVTLRDLVERNIVSFKPEPAPAPAPMPAAPAVLEAPEPEAGAPPAPAPAAADAAPSAAPAVSDAAAAPANAPPAAPDAGAGAAAAAPPPPPAAEAAPVDAGQPPPSAVVSALAALAAAAAAAKPKQDEPPPPPETQGI